MPDLDDDVRLLADECAAEARHFVETAVEVASGAAVIVQVKVPALA